MNQPLYKRVYDRLFERIRSGDYLHDTMLPSEPKLAEEFAVSLITVRRAIHELVLDGLVESRQGIGNVVRDGSSGSVVVRMSSFTRDVAAGRLRIVRTLMEDGMVQTPADVARRLGVQPGSMVRRLVRLDCDGGVPLSVDEAYIPPALATAITPEMAASPLFLDMWQEAAGIELASVESEISVEVPIDRDRDLLSIGPEVPVLVTGELIKGRSGRAKFWIVTRYRSDRCRLASTAMLVRKNAGEGRAL